MCLSAILHSQLNEKNKLASFALRSVVIKFESWIRSYFALSVQVYMFTYRDCKMIFDFYCINAGTIRLFMISVLCTEITYNQLHVHVIQCKHIFINFSIRRGISCPSRNILYVYPRSVNFAGKQGGSFRNLAVRVQFMAIEGDRLISQPVSALLLLFLTWRTLFEALFSRESGDFVPNWLKNC